MQLTRRLRRVSALAVAAAATGAVIAAVAVTSCASRCGGERPAPPVRFATFNIEDFPRDAAQIDGAFALIAALDLDLLAVQEITEPRAFAANARERLGDRWAFVHTGDAPAAAAYPRHRLGLLHDARAYRRVTATYHDDTRIDGRGQPVLDVRLEPRRGGAPLRVLVVHFKSGSDGRPRRAREHAALAAIVARIRRDDPAARLVIAGDFNATDDADRADLAALARAARLAWATEPVPCTAFWRRAGDCATSRLDHVLTWGPPRDARARGACETDGCAARDRCPAYRDRISDHCPVTVTLP